MERSIRKQLTGKVVSNKTDKTIQVQIEAYVEHPLYGKRYLKTKKVAAHDEANVSKVGDKVLLAETRPFSKTKKFRLVKVIVAAGEGE